MATNAETVRPHKTEDGGCLVCILRSVFNKDGTIAYLGSNSVDELLEKLQAEHFDKIAKFFLLTWVLSELKDNFTRKHEGAIDKRDKNNLDGQRNNFLKKFMYSIFIRYS